MASSLFALLTIFCLLCFSNSANADSYRLLGKFSSAHVAFLNIDSFAPNYSQALLLTSFSINSHQISYVPQISGHLSDLSDVRPISVSTQVVWPNQAETVPYEIFNQTALIAAGGFLVPFSGQNTGAVTLFTGFADNGSETNIQGPFQISVDKNDWFYHMTTWFDVDGDGLQDILTARATKPIIGSSGGELVWYKQPDSNPFGQQWTPTVLTEGPDVYFRLVDLDQDASTPPEIIAAQFFSSKLVLYYTTSNDWTDPSSIKSVLLDDTLGPVFDLRLSDLNNDGKVDLLVTNHVDNATLSGVYAYEIPEDYKTSSWTKHTLANGFQTTEGGSNQASPGEAIPFWAQTNQVGQIKPSILLAGDGSQSAFLISPNSQTSSDWTYTTTTIIDVKGTVGQLAVGDVDGDGYVEFFVPDYDHGIVYGYTFSP